MLKSKIVVVPSQFNEPFGLVAIEALMAGCIPIVSDVGGIFEACLGHAFKFKATSSQELADLLEATLQDFKVKRDAIFSNFQSEYFQIERMINEYSKYIDKVLESR
jgi:glycosyltransferase involved in cell wall biosynthesis